MHLFSHRDVYGVDCLKAFKGKKGPFVCSSVSWDYSNVLGATDSVLLILLSIGIKTEKIIAEIDVVDGLSIEFSMNFANNLRLE